MDKITYTNNINVDDYNALRKSAGWNEIYPEQAKEGLSGSALIIAAANGKQTIGTARLIWDGGYAALIKDVLILPEYQGMGIGTEMIRQIIQYLKDHMKPGWGVAVDLMSAVGKEAFYQKCGFDIRPRDNRGAGMDLWLDKPL